MSTSLRQPWHSRVTGPAYASGHRAFAGALLGLMLVCQPAPALDLATFFGGGAVGQIVYDPTNHLETAISASQAVRQTTLQVRAEIQRIQQLEAELLQLQALPEQVIRDSLQDWNQQLATLRDAARTLGALGAQLNASQQRYSGQLREIALLGVSPKAYLAHEIQAASARGSAQGSLFDADRNSLQTIEQARVRLARLQRQIPGSSGVHQSLQTSNQYLDLLAGQITQLLQLSAAQASLAASQRAAEESSMVQADTREAQRVDADLQRITVLRQTLRVQEAQQGWGVLHPLP